MIDGYVQRVGYRYKVAYIARKYNLKGKIENIKDGGVEIIVEGNKEDIESFINDIDIKEFPVFVERLDTRYEEVKNEFKTFKIVTSSLAEEMIEGFGTGALYLDKIMSTQNKMLDKQDQTINEIKGLREDLSMTVDRRLRKIEEDMARIKAKLNLDH